MKTYQFVACLLMSLIWSSRSHAFNWDRCEREVLNKGGTHLSPGNRQGLFGATTVQKTTNSSASSTSYVSSTGACAAFAGTSLYERRVFIVENREELGKQCARGSGEHLETLASLYGCTETSRPEVMRAFHEGCEESLLTNASVTRVDDSIKKSLSVKASNCLFLSSID